MLHLAKRITATNNKFANMLHAKNTCTEVGGIASCMYDHVSNMCLETAKADAKAMVAGTSL